MGKYIDIKVGKKLKLYRFASGYKQDQTRWALFSFTPYETDPQGNTFYGQEYTIFIDNINNVNRVLQDGDMVEIASINSVSSKDNTYKGKDNQQHTKRVIQVAVNIVINNQNVNNNNNMNNNNVQYNNYDNSQNDNTPPVFDGDGYNMPSF